jgi:hypothetical protein
MTIRLSGFCRTFRTLPLTIRNGGESHSDCSMLEVSPLADVPRPNLLRVCKRLQLGREPTDTENSTYDGERNLASV